MDYVPITHFRRAVDAALLANASSADHMSPCAERNKYESLRELATGRDAFGLTDRDLTVLQALVSFFPGPILEADSSNLVVHPSNKSICERLNGMAESTMRRHLSNLIRSGVITRRDSPNGKRYVRRYGTERLAFGFDLSPLIHRFDEFSHAAEAVREAELRRSQLREKVSLMRRDLASLADFGSASSRYCDIWATFGLRAKEVARYLRRKLDIDTLEALSQDLKGHLETAQRLLEFPESGEMSTSAADNEQHYQNSDKEYLDSESDLHEPNEAVILKTDTADEGKRMSCTDRKAQPVLPLDMILDECAEFRSFIDRPIRHWRDLVEAADSLRPMLGISSSAWFDAKRAMGCEEAAIVLAVILERLKHIRCPGGYLRALSTKAQSGHFSSVPMVMALTRRCAG